MSFRDLSNRSEGGHRGGRRARAVSRRGAVWLAATCCTLGVPGIGRAQETTELITTDLPFPEYYRVGDDHYGHHIGKVQMHYGASVAMTFTDNRNLNSRNQEADFGVNSTANLGGFYVFDDRQKFQIDVGVGYQWWLNSHERDGLYITPSSHIDYACQLGDVRVSLSNTSSTSADATSRPEYSGGVGNSQQDLAFYQLRNVSDVGANWALNRSFSVAGNYGFTLERSLNDQFQSLDSDRHMFRIEPQWHISAPLTLGLYGTYSIYDYLQDVQNDGTMVSGGGSVYWRARDNLNVSLSAGYSKSEFDQNGSIQDTSNFGGPTFSLSIAHTMNKYMNETLAASRGMEGGFGSNYTDSYSVTYGLTARLARFTPVLTVTYNNFTQSGNNGQSGGTYRISLGTGFQLTRRLNLGTSYTANIRSTGDADQDYLENRIAATLSASF